MTSHKEENGITSRHSCGEIATNQFVSKASITQGYKYNTCFMNESNPCSKTDVNILKYLKNNFNPKIESKQRY